MSGTTNKVKTNVLRYKFTGDKTLLKSKEIIIIVGYNPNQVMIDFLIF